MEIGLGVVGLSPKDFWEMSFKEFYSAVEGFKTPLSKNQLEDLMERYPD